MNMKHTCLFWVLSFQSIGMKKNQIRFILVDSEKDTRSFNIFLAVVFLIVTVLLILFFIVLYRAWNK
jgi:hypothetical protein